MLLLTFSRRAAAEMQRRVERIAAQALGGKAQVMTDALAWSGTFHAIGARLVREYALDIGLNREFTIHDREDSADLMNLVRHDLGLSKKDKRFPMKGTCLAIYSRAVNAQAPLGDTLGSFFPWCAEWEAQLRELFGAYVEAKQKQNVLDYDDLLLYWAQMMVEGAIAQNIAARFDHVLVDEYQDTNGLQASILLALKPTGRGLTVVGDDAQSIYSFRAATVRNILDFPGHFSPRADVVTLERNYRSTQAILAAANAVIDLASERFTKNLWSERASAERPTLVNVADDVAQARYIVETILENREAGTALKSQAVLFRASHHSAGLEVELTRRNIPFVKFGGLKFLEASHIKDVLAVLRFAQNTRDRVAGFRVAQLLPGIGPGIAARLLDTMSESADPARALAGFKPPASAAAHWPEFEATVGMLRRNVAGWPAEVDLVCRWYAPHLERIHDNAETRQADLTQLAQIASGYPNRERFLTELTLDPPDATSDQAGVPLLDEDYLILSTIHSAKGPGMDFRFSAQYRRRMPAIGFIDQIRARNRGRAQAALCRHDARQGPVAVDGAAALLHPWPAWQRRPPRLCATHAFHSKRLAQALRMAQLAGRGARETARRRSRTSNHRRARQIAPHVGLTPRPPACARRAAIAWSAAATPVR